MLGRGIERKAEDKKGKGKVRRYELSAKGSSQIWMRTEAQPAIARLDLPPGEHGAGVCRGWMKYIKSTFPQGKFHIP